MFHKKQVNKKFFLEKNVDIRQPVQLYNIGMEDRFFWTKDKELL
jgi:hypothetical protein